MTYEQTRMHVTGIASRRDLPGVLATAGLSRRICEVGVRFGTHFRDLLGCNPEEAVAVDHWRAGVGFAKNDQDYDFAERERQFSSFQREFAGAPNVRVVRAMSAEAARLFGEGHFDFVYLDADHSFDGILADLQTWWQRIRSGGLIGGHDYVQRTLVNQRTGEQLEFGVVRAVNEFTEAKRLLHTLHVTTGDKYPSWFLVKPT